MDVGALLMWEGALVLGVLVVRAICLRVLGAENIPVLFQKRIQIGTRLTPALMALSVVMIAIGILARIAR